MPIVRYMDGEPAGKQLARRPGERVSRPDLRRRGGLPPPGRAAAGDRLRLPSWASTAAGATSAPRSRRSSATRRRNGSPTPSLWAAPAAPRRPRAGARPGERAGRSANPQPAARSTTGCITRDGDVVWILDEAVLEPDDDGVPVWHGVLYDITERKSAEEELQRAVAQQATVARLGEPALQRRRPRGADGRGGLADGRDRRRRQRLHLGGRPRRPPPQLRAGARGSR